MRGLKSQFWELNIRNDDRDPTQVSRRLLTLIDRYLPEEVPGENVTRAESILMPQAIVEKLELFFFVLFNGILRKDESWDSTVVEVSKQLKLHLKDGPLRTLTASHHQYYQTAREAIFASSVRIGDPGLVSSFIREGIDQELPIQMDGFQNRVCMDWILTYDTCVMTPLEVAFCNSDVDLATILIEKGAKIERKRSSLSSAELVVAEVGKSSSSQLSLLKIVLKEDKSLSTVHIWNASRLAIDRKSYGCARLLLDTVWHRGHESIHSTELLCQAIRVGHMEMVNSLLDAGTDVNDYLEVAAFGYGIVAPLTTAILLGKKKIYRELLNRGAAPDGLQLEHPSPLQCAAFMNDDDAIRLLLEFHANINQITDGNWFPWSFGSRRGHTALQSALLRGSKRAAHALLKRGARPIGGELVMAIEKDLGSICHILLTAGVSVNDTAVDSNVTALEAAIVNRNEPVVRYILSSNQYIYNGGALCAAMSTTETPNISPGTLLNAILQHRNPSGNDSSDGESSVLEGTALAIAAIRGQTSLVCQLLSKGLIPQHCYSYLTHKSHFMEGSSLWWRGSRVLMPVLGSISQADTAIVSLFLQKGYPIDTNSICMAAQYSCPSVLEIFLDKTPIPITQWRRAPLLCAISAGNLDAVRTLLRHDIERDLTAPGFDWHAFQSVTSQQMLQLIHLLLDNGRDVRTEDLPFFQEVLQITARHGYITCVELLLQAGAGLGHAGSTLQEAVHSGSMDVVEILLDYGARVDYGVLALAVGYGFLGLVETLLSACVHNPEIEDLKSPEAWARLIGKAAGNSDMERLLMNASAIFEGAGQLRDRARASSDCRQGQPLEIIRQNVPNTGAESSRELGRGYVSSAEDWFDLFIQLPDNVDG